MRISQKDIESFNEKKNKNSLNTALDTIISALPSILRNEAMEKGFMLYEKREGNKKCFILKVPGASKKLQERMEEVLKKAKLVVVD